MSSAAVYRLYDADDRLLYIGLTSDLEARMHDHFHAANPAAATISGPLIRKNYARHDVTVYATRAQAAAAEKVAIRTEAPLYNRLGNPAWRPGSAT